MNARMKTSLQVATAALLLAVGFGAYAENQGNQEPVTIDELRSPTSPAFTILGVAPTNIVRPNTPRELAAEVLSAKDRGEGNLPSDLALEFSPYWLLDHSKLTFGEYYSTKSIAKTIVRSLSVSVATADIPDENVEGTTLGLGIRFLLVPGKMDPELMELKVQVLQQIQLEMLEQCVEEISDEAGAPTEAIRCSEEEMAAFLPRLKKAAAEIKKMNLQRTGWVVEAALGSSRDYPDANDAANHDRQFGAWLTASYQMRDPNELTLLACARLLEDRTGIQGVRMKDLGARLIYESPTLPVSLSVEAMHRDMDGGDSSTSVLAVLEYPISDTLRLVASYGKGLATPTNESDLVATLSVNFGFGKGPSVSLDKLPL